MQDIKEIYLSLPKTYQRSLMTLAQYMAKQSKKGKEKYGMTIDENKSEDFSYWQNHFLEELADGLVYLQKLLELYGHNRNSEPNE